MDNVFIYESSELASSFAEELFNKIISVQKKKGKVCIALSGGNTPVLLFNEIIQFYSSKIEWDNIHFFWVDERCVPPDHDESNYGMTKKFLLNHITASTDHIHRIKGENDPSIEAVRYSVEVRSYLPTRNSFPSYDIIILGIGEDGHTASIFPDQMHFLESPGLYVTSFHPVSRQPRISMTGTFINNSEYVYFMISGRSKSKVVQAILGHELSAENYPANYICPLSNNLYWFIDSEAAELLNH